MDKEGFKSGFISIIGRPNVGKSTLLNQFLGDKLAIISEKPQTTRHRILGIKNLPKAQLIFLDTPGIHRAKNLLNKMMVEVALSTFREADLLLFMVEATHPGHPGDQEIIKTFKQDKTLVILLVNKIDKVKKEELLPMIKDYSGLFSFKAIVPLSAWQGEGVDLLLEEIVKLLPEGPQYFPSEMITDLPERFLAAELIREKVFNLTQEEVPYSTTVLVEEFKEREGGLLYIRATIYVEKDSQKGIIIGQGGKKLKEIGRLARLDLEGLFGGKVYLDLWVKVQKNWSKDDKFLKRIYQPV